MKRILLGLLLSGLGWADPGMLKIVTTNTTPGIKPVSFASKPRTVYRLGNSLARVEHKVKARADAYEYKQDPYRVRLSVRADKPRQLEVFENGKLILRLHYDQYTTGLPENRALFQVPKGIQINSEG